MAGSPVLAPACDDACMFEYGQGVGEVAGRAGGGSGPVGRSPDWGASISHFMSDSVNTLSSMPPMALLGGFAVIVIALFLLKRAF